VDPSTQLWTTRYASQTIKEICGNKVQVEKLQQWLTNWCVGVLPGSLSSCSFSFACSLFVFLFFSLSLSFPRFALLILILITDSPPLPPFLRITAYLSCITPRPNSLKASFRKPDKNGMNMYRAVLENRVTWYREDDDCASVCEIGGVCAG
jgi:hypothetical protein